MMCHEGDRLALRVRIILRRSAEIVAYTTGAAGRRSRMRGSTIERGKFRIQERGTSDENDNETQVPQSSITAIDPLRRPHCSFSGRVCGGTVRDGVWHRV